MSAAMKFPPRLNISSSLSRIAIHDKQDRLKAEYAATGSFCKQSVTINKPSTKLRIQNASALFSERRQ